MAFQLHIRQNLDTEGGAFRRGDVQEFDCTRVRVGSGQSCECRIDDPAFEPVHVTIEQRQRLSGADRSASARTFAAIPAAGAATFVNDEPLDEPLPLRSGDRIRIGHWTLRFQKLYERTGRTHRFGMLSLLAKGLVVLILVLEVAVVTWLPRYMQRAAMWDNELARQRIAELLDDLRRDNRRAAVEGDFERALRRAVGRELADRAQLISQHGDALSAEQNRMLYNELTDFAGILQDADDGSLLPAQPGVDIDGGVKGLLDRYQGESITDE